MQCLLVLSLPPAVSPIPAPKRANTRRLRHNHSKGRANRRYLLNDIISQTATPPPPTLALASPFLSSRPSSYTAVHVRLYDVSKPSPPREVPPLWGEILPRPPPRPCPESRIPRPGSASYAPTPSRPAPALCACVWHPIPGLNPRLVSRFSELPGSERMQGRRWGEAQGVRQLLRLLVPAPLPMMSQERVPWIFAVFFGVAASPPLVGGESRSPAGLVGASGGTGDVRDCRRTRSLPSAARGLRQRRRRWFRSRGKELWRREDRPRWR